MCDHCELLASVAPWQAVNLYSYTAKQIDLPDELPPYAAKLAAGTAEYEQKIRDAWEDLKANPTVARAKAFAELLVLISGELWPVVFAEVIGIDVEDLTPEQQDLLDEYLEEHHKYIRTSLMPDIVRGVEQGLDLKTLDYRTTFLYAGALWAFGNVATVMFDGLSLRDLADLFLFAGPNDEATCTGERGCAQYANNIYTVAQILAENIFPGRLRCLTNCRHIWLPIASPLTEKKELFGGNGVVKHLPGRHDQQTHAPHSTGVPKVLGSYDPDPQNRRVSSSYAGGGSYTEVDGAIKVPVKYFNDKLGLHTFASCEGHEEDWSSNGGRLGYNYDGAGRLIDSPFQSSYIGVRSSSYVGGKLYDYLKNMGFSEGSTERQLADATKKQLYKNSSDGKTHLVYDYKSDGMLAFRVGTGVIDMSKSEPFEFAGKLLRNADSSYEGQMALSQVEWDAARDANWEEYMELLSGFE